MRGVPWNGGKEDDEADGDVPEFYVTHGPGRRLTPGEMEEMATQETPSIVHRAHLTKKNFDKFCFTDRCRGCSAIIRGLRVQPHAEHCRRRLEKHLENDLRVKNAKVRLSERNRKVREEQGHDMDHKRRKLDDFEDAVMEEYDPEQSATLYEQFRKEYEEYLMEKAEKEGSDVKRRKLADAESETMESCAPKRDRASSQEDPLNDKRQKGEHQMQEVGTSSTEDAVYQEMNIHQVLEQEWIDKEKGEQDQIDEYAWDDVNDMELPIEKVREARTEEMKYMKGKTLKVVKKSEAYRITGEGPINTKWVDTDKSYGNGEMLVRSRWVARDFKLKGEKNRENLFSATPPLELIRYVISRQATMRADGQERKTLYIDVKKAHLVAKCTQDVYVELPAGVQEDECGKLIYWLYGCRPAAQAWEEHYSGVLTAVGFKRLLSSPVAFYHPERDLVRVVHGDDFVFVGVDKELDFVLGVLKELYELKDRGRLGSGDNNKKEVDLLGRKIRWHGWGLTLEGDDRHRKM